ncbi:hypothetical protein A2U01_0084796, partial [Trifolium medium]|nr:hypothetical protein [Trifolium medium]
SAIPTPSTFSVHSMGVS